MSYQTTPHRTQQPTEQGRAEQWSRPALLAAAALAASFFYVRSKARQAEAENPPQGQFIEVDGVRLHYLERGSGPPLVMLHGNGILANEFDTSGLLDEAAACSMKQRPNTASSLLIGPATATANARAPRSGPRPRRQG